MKKPIIQYADFQKLDIRVGEIISAEKLENSKNLLKLLVNFGADYGNVEILSGLVQYYSPKSLQGNKYVFLVNLEPRKLMGTFSNGMILVVNDTKKPILFKVKKSLQNGTAIA
ncbi:MAG: methionine--tRNA ligase, partial [bacterium]|nr:methionine--tRNA ligase [bacterium]